MTLASQVLALASAVGGAIKGLRTRDLPAYAHSNPTHLYDANRSTYNATASTLRRFRLACARTAAGVSSTHIASTGDSSGGGFNGVSYDTSLAMPRQMALVVAMSLGVPFYDGVCTANAGSGVGDRWTISGGGGSSVTFTANNFLTLSAAGYVEFTSPAGTSVDIYYSDLSSGFTIAVDGEATPRPVSPGGTNTWRKFTVSGLAATSHKVRVNWVAGTAYIAGGMAYTPGAVGVYFHNLTLGGSAAATGGSFINWSDPATSGVRFSHTSMLALAGVSTPDLHTNQIGGNDHAAGTPNSTIMAGLASIKSMWDCDFVSIRAYMTGGGSDAASFDDLCKRYLLYADSGNHVNFDWNDLAGGRAGIVASGGMSSDSVHAKHEVNVHAGRTLGSALALGAHPDIASRAYVDLTKLDISSPTSTIPGALSVAGAVATGQLSVTGTGSTSGSFSVGGILTGNNLRENAQTRNASFPVSNSSSGLQLCDATSAAITATLYNASSTPGQKFTFVKTDNSGNQVSFAIAGTGGSILGGLIALAAQGDTVTLESTSTAGLWIVPSRPRYRNDNYTGNVNVGGALMVTGQFQSGTASKLGAYRAVSINTTINGSTDKYVEFTQAVVATLPTASSFSGFDYYLINSSDTAMTVQGGTAAQTIGNSSTAAQTYSLPAGASLHIVSTGTKWRVIG